MTDLASLLEHGDTPYPESGTEPPREGRRLGMLSAYKPSWRDRAAAVVAGDENSPFRQHVARRLLGSTGLGPSADPNAAWRALPSVAPAIDAAEAAYHDKHLPFAAKALDAGLEAAMVGQLRNLPLQLWAKPPLPARQRFSVPIKSPAGEKAGYVSGNVAGDTAHVSGAFKNVDDGTKSMANTIGTREMLRVFNDLRDRYPHLARVTALRVSGARVGPAAKKERHLNAAPETAKQRLWEDGGIMDEMLVVADRATKGRLGNSRTGDKLMDFQDAVATGGRGGHNLDVEVTPLWRQILNEAGGRGVP